MIWVVGVVVAMIILVVVVIPLLKGHSIANRHAATLSNRTGIPADQIKREMLRSNMTPGEWAARHGLHPLSFEPLSASNVGRDHGTGGGVDGEMRPTQVAVDRLRSLANTPLAGWTMCPVCTGDLVSPFEDMQACKRCFRAYTVGGIEPVARNDGDTVVMSGTQPYLPLIMTHMARAQYPILVWHVRPPDVTPSAPPILPDDELEERAFHGA